MPGRVLTVAESDAGGSAGIQADVKTILALGGYASTAVSAIFAQDTGGAGQSFPLDPALVSAQMRAVLGDIGAEAIKIGYLADEATVNAVGDILDECKDSGIPVITDPSIVARDNTVLVDEAAIAAWKRRLYLRTTVLTPNLREAELLTGMHIRDMDDMRHAADMMRTLGVESVVLKAGQAPGDKALYFIADEDGEIAYERPRLDTRHTLGAGCTLSAAIAISIAQGLTLRPAVERALDFMHQAILNAPGYGRHAGPMNHAFDIEKHSSFFHPGNVKVLKA